MTHSLADYLHGVTRCDDADTLTREYGIQDNYAILLFGEPSELFRKINEAFAGNGQLETTWNVQETYEDSVIYETADGVRAQMYRGRHGRCLSKDDRVGGLDHSLFLMFHPRRSEEIKQLKPKILDVITYLAKDGIPFRIRINDINVAYDPRDRRVEL